MNHGFPGVSFLLPASQNTGSRSCFCIRAGPQVQGEEQEL